jgi:hypothetical protein
MNPFAVFELYDTFRQEFLKDLTEEEEKGFRSIKLSDGVSK